MEMRHLDIECAFRRIVGVVSRLIFDSRLGSVSLRVIYLTAVFYSVRPNVGAKIKCHE